MTQFDFNRIGEADYVGVFGLIPGALLRIKERYAYNESFTSLYIIIASKAKHPTVTVIENNSGYVRDLHINTIMFYYEVVL